MPRIDRNALEDFVARALATAGLPAQDARVAAQVFADADAAGVGTHGLARLPAYVGALQDGMINPAPRITVERRAAILRIDGDNGLGPVVATKAMDETVALARETGIALALVRRSNHFGVAAAYSDRAAAAGMIGIVLSNTSAVVAAHGGREPVLGSNPIAAAVAGSAQPGLSVDFSTAAASRGTLRRALRERQPLPEGWAVTPDGTPARDPQSALDGALLPMSGPKGTGLALLVDLLSGVLSGAGFGGGIGSMYGRRGRSADVGHAFIAIDIVTARPEGDFAERWDAFVAPIRASIPAEEGGAVLLPGERRAARRAESMRLGVAINEALWTEALELARRLDIRAPEPLQPGTVPQR